MIIGWPQMLIILSFGIHLGIYAVKNGQPREDKYEIQWALGRVAIFSLILWWGGFFTK